MKNLANKLFHSSRNGASKKTDLPLSYPNNSGFSHGISKGKIHTSAITSRGRLRALKVVLCYLSQPSISVPLSWFGLVSVPLFIFGGIPRSAPGGLLQAWRNGWDSILHLSVFLVIAVTLLGAFFIVHYTTTYNDHTTDHSVVAKSKREKWHIRNIGPRIWKLVGTPPRLSLCIIVLFIQLTSFTSIQQVVSPGWLWNPFLVLYGYRVFWPSELAPAMEKMCLDYKLGEASDRDPLCLTEDAWDVLSAGALSSSNNEDVEGVLNGISYLRTQSRGLVVSVMGRDVDEHIDPLRLNVESLVPFVPNLAVVAFENDSNDGSREHFIRWQQEANKKYNVDLIDCPDAENCKFGRSSRYDSKHLHDYWESSTIGDMHKFRQLVVDHITSSKAYKDYSHILQIDLDIGVSISPLGILHSLGHVQNRAIASSGRQPWAGGMGTLALPYDFNAFESLPTRDTKWLKSLHKRFCGVMPPGDRWRFVCEAASPMKFLQIVQLDRANSFPYPVASAYNGATLYPLKLIREAQPKYDAGEDGQTCEHVSFNRGLKQPMFVNPKWDFHMSPTHPGGPKGEEALKHVRHWGSVVPVAIPMALMNIVPLSTLVLSVMTIGVHYLKRMQAVLRMQKSRDHKKESEQHGD